MFLLQLTWQAAAAGLKPSRKGFIMVIGVTGPTGAGKSTVTEFLSKKYNLFIIDADKIARQVTAKKSPALKEIENTFGKDYINSDGELNRKALGKLVFSDKEQLEKLNCITHKYIIEEIESLVRSNDICILDAPLLFETNLDLLCEKIILVTGDEAVRAERIMKRDLITIETAMNRIRSQKDYSLYIPKCHLVINNNNDSDLSVELAEVKCWLKN